MPIKLKLLDNGIGLGFIVKGNISGKELIEAARNVYKSHELFKKNIYGIIDYTSVEKFDVSASDVEKIAELSKEASKIAPYRLIAVVANDDLSFGYSRMWEFLSSEINWERRVFRLKSEAEEWLKKRTIEKFNITITLR